MRLSGGSTSNEGRVELCVSGQWKTVCDNNWSMSEAQVVCEHLGYASQGTVNVLLLSVKHMLRLSVHSLVTYVKQLLNI